MQTNKKFTAIWHQESFERFIQAQLPQLLAVRLPLAGYTVDSTGPYSCQIAVTVAAADGAEIEVTYKNLPQPDEAGVFLVDGLERTVVPLATNEALDTAAIQCVGDFLYTYIEERLGQASPDLPWDATLLRAWLPLDKWLWEFMTTHRHAQVVDGLIWLAKQSHLRRIMIANPRRVVSPGQFGRVSLFEAPEGPNLGRIFAIALGATIQDGKLIITDEKPAAQLGLSASMIPCLEHDDPNRLLMGANMMRQWLPYHQPEPALVQSGNEPDVPDFWGGRNLLTAFMPWGGDTFEDGIVLSESAAQRLSNLEHAPMRAPFDGDLYHKIEPGDKLSNRHGAKGVVSRILPDAQMPHLPDGTPIELICSSMKISGRVSLGYLREALLGRIARYEGKPLVAPPFAGPSEPEIRQRAQAAGLPEDGLETLIRGDTGQPFAQPSVAGWLYWGRTFHLARDKLQVSADVGEGIQRQAELEYQMLRAIGATETIKEHFHTRATMHLPDVTGEQRENPVGGNTLRQQIANGHIVQAIGTAPRFRMLQNRLAAAGIQMAIKDNQLHFQFVEEVQDQDQDKAQESRMLTLARAVPHPWLPQHQITTLLAHPQVPTDKNFAFWSFLHAYQYERGADAAASFTPMPEYTQLVETNSKLARLLEKEAPKSLVEQAYAQVEQCVQRYFAALLTWEDTRFDNRVLFSGRTVAAPGPELRYDQIALPEEIAWTLFGPFVERKLREVAGVDSQILTSTVGDVDYGAAVEQRGAEAAKILDELMATMWVVVNHPPSTKPTTLLAFHPVLEASRPEKSRVVRLHPMACRLLNADFDGDHIAVFLPLTDAGQQEAGDKLSLAGHLARDQSLINELAPRLEAMWGLASLSLEEGGRAEINEMVGQPVDATAGFVTRTTLVEALHAVLQKQGASATLALIEQLLVRGFAVAHDAGFCMSPFVGQSCILLPAPAERTPEKWQIYQEQVMEQLLAYDDYTLDIAPYMLGIKSGALPRGHLQTLLYLLGVPRVATDVHGKLAIPEHGFRDGLTVEDFHKLVPGAREGLARIARDWEAAGTSVIQRGDLNRFNVMARARRAPHPGVVFARAAAIGEVDPLVDESSRLFVGVSC